MLLLKQSTSVDVPIGPFLDETDGKTAETALTITQPDIRLKKNDTAWAQKNAAQTLSHEEAGWYEVTLDATDTNTLGHLIVAVHESGALPVWREFLVVPAAVYDALVSGSGNGLRADVQVIAAGAVSASAVGTGAIDADAIASDAITAAKIAAGAIDEATFAADADKYQAKVWLFDDNSGTNDRYVVVWFKNGQPITSGITSPTIQVIKVADGTDLVASTAMTEIGSLGMYRYNEATNRIVDGVAYIVKVQATIGGSTRSWYQPVGRDS